MTVRVRAAFGTGTDGGSMGFEFRLLGPVEVVSDGTAVPVPAAKQRIVLATLLLDAGRVVPVETLVDRLWDEDPPAGARNTLQNHVLRLRRTLGACGGPGPAGQGPVRTCQRGYAIDVAEGALDLHRFDVLTRHAKSALAAGDAARASVLLSEALGLWRGRPLADVPSASLQRDVVPSLLERRTVALELRVGADLRLGRHTELLPELAELTAAYPLQEPFWAQRMLALHRAGRQGEALRCYRTVSALLAEELGVDPGAALRDLHRRMLADDPSLAVPAPRATAGALDIGDSSAAARDTGGARGATAGSGHGPRAATPDPREDSGPRAAAPGPREDSGPRAAAQGPGGACRAAAPDSGGAPGAAVRGTGGARGAAAREDSGLRAAAPALGGARGGIAPDPSGARGTACPTPSGTHGATEPQSGGAPPHAPVPAPRPEPAAPGIGSVPRPGAQLPADTTSFVGRCRERAKAAQLLDIARLVTLTGVGGVGKTRLALRVAADVSGSCPDGAWAVDLAPLTDPRLLDRAVCEALGFRDHSALPAREVLLQRLRDMRALLVLDNCEHVVPAAADLVHALLRAAPGLRVLATSRHLLGVPGEHVLPLPPLAQDEALRLLADRALASAPDLAVAAAHGDTARDLCRRLDGIPLAIELAAIRLATLSVEEILERLDDRFQVLADVDTYGGATSASRYGRTLRGVVDWSHDLCTGSEQLLWARLSVFSGDFGLEAAETVCSGDGIDREEVVRLLSALVAKSILSTGRRASRTRYRMLETIRQYGRARLRERGQETALRRRHLDYYRSLAAAAATRWCGPEEVDWLARLRHEVLNIRAALDFGATHPGAAAAGLEIATSLTRTRFWFFSSTLGEGRHWFERTLAAEAGAHSGAGPAAVDEVPPSGPPPDPVRIGAVSLQSWIALCQGDRPAARRFLDDCYAMSARLPHGPALPQVLFIRGADAILTHGCGTSIALLDRARARMREAGLTGDAHMATMLWAMACGFFGEREAAFAACQEYVADGRTHGGPWAGSWTLWVHGLTELLHGDPGTAVRLVRDSLLPQWAIDDRWGPVWGVESLAWAAEATGEPDYAARLLGAAARLRRTTGVSLDGLTPFYDVHVRTVRRARAALGDEAYVAAFARGTDTTGAGLRDLVLRT
ncbi:BTAD domain-containing putative transcriptional regulator [Streptomyces longispororuber]|uniref:AfsR/SARP family transcriptional regulator n=1 Tax=Streptomyces longispororuber TaxID=68230 RepID=UPI0037023A40